MCKFTRTASAGGLLELDGSTILLDAVCGGVGPYLPTPPGLLDALLERGADLMAFTHAHPDHLDPCAVEECLYAWGGVPVLGTGEAAEALSPWPVMVGEEGAAGSVRVTPIPSRHMGAAYQDVEHNSLWVEGSRRCLFLGDAAPTQWEGRALRPDVLFAPFVYAATEAGWHMVESLLPGQLVLLHMPARGNDPERLWGKVEAVLARRSGIPVSLPEMGETVDLR